MSLWFPWLAQKQLYDWCNSCWAVNLKGPASENSPRIENLSRRFTDPINIHTPSCAFLQRPLKWSQQIHTSCMGMQMSLVPCLQGLATVQIVSKVLWRFVCTVSICLGAYSMLFGVRVPLSIVYVIQIVWPMGSEQYGRWAGRQQSASVQLEALGEPTCGPLLPGAAETWTSSFPFVLSKGSLPTSARCSSWLCPELATRERDNGRGNGRRIMEEREEVELLKSLIQQQGANF